MIPVLFTVLLVWNVWLTAELQKKNEVVYVPGDTGEAPVIQETLTDYTTDVTGTVENNRTHAVYIRTIAGQTEKNASGVIFSRDGDTSYIITTADVLSGSSEVYAVFDNGVEVSCEMVGIDPATGIGLIAAVPSFETVPFVIGDSDLLEEGEYVITMGGRAPSSGTGSVSFGVASGAGNRRVSSSSFWFSRVIETDASVTSGNYGGALLDVGGKLAGILIPRPIDSEEGMGYALSVNEAKEVFRQLKENGSVTRGSLGVSVRSIADMQVYEKSALGIALDMNYGVYAADITEGGAAEDIIEKGDLLLMINGERIESEGDLRQKLYGYEAETEAVLTIRRAEEETEVDVVLR